MSQLSGSKQRNIIPKNIVSTQKNYLYSLWNFHYWLVGQEFSYDFLVPIDESTYQMYSKTVILTGLEHFLKIWECTHQNSKQFFTQLIAKYLKDPIHIKKKQSTLKIDYYAIKAYFDNNDHPLDFKFNFKKKDKVSDNEESEKLFTLNGLLQILTIGQPTLMQKAAFLCKFHRGLDTSTFVNEFNFKAWDQITKSFDTSDWKKWDFKLCPIPIKLTRIKTGVKHVGFLDVDAISVLKRYMQYRKSKTGKEIQKGDPIFVNHFNKPITEDWMRRSFRKLIRNAGLEYLIKDNGDTPKQLDFLRILLKSTLIECGTDRDVENGSIGHKVNYFSKKSTELEIENMRLEYTKASKTINVFQRLEKILNSAEY